ncbi:ABC transporter substrate-binding protein [Acetobacterium paludosum]|uniref:ABC transporter substrate-binding protein n=1 Tax=Acetobacterium paludosum TaxID=52693 RepID=A0A923I2H6_9FIRM|nr:ABC transporter substrate-binding protein [Acetobacterium paludosum]MBC3887895.1 ABC transporter substrate-binding protein [Acetobacterium paludosum]
MKDKIKIAVSLCLLIVMGSFMLMGCSNSSDKVDGKLEFDSKMELKYAQNFSVDNYKGGYKMITLKDGSKYLTVPEGKRVPADLDADVTVLQLPLTNVCLASTGAASLITGIDALNDVTLTTQKRDSWYIDEVGAAMDSGQITYIGDYDTPDYEALTAKQPQLLIYSGMLDTHPEVAAKFKELGLNCLVDRSSDEQHPLGRVEWVKLFGILFNKEAEAQKLFDEQEKVVDSINATSTGKTVLAFYRTTNGACYIRNGGDYFAKMIELAGGVYYPANFNTDKGGTTKMDAETFYQTAADADYIIYIDFSSTEQLTQLSELVAKDPLFADLKAVKNGNVWSTQQSFWQVNATLGNMISDINTAITATDNSHDNLTYLYKLK